MDLSLRSPHMITTILTTAPLPSMPHADLLLYTARSLQLVPRLLEERILVAFDGFRVEGPSFSSWLHPKCRQRFEDHSLYDRYKQGVKRAILDDWSLARATFVELGRRSCLATLLRAAIEHVDTPFVHVMQADMPLMRAFDVATVLDAMRSHPRDVQLVRLAFKRNVDHEQFAAIVCNHSSAPITLHHGSITLSRSSSWADNNHIATTSHYRHAVLPFVRDGDFPEHAIYCSPLVRPMGTWFLGAAHDGLWVGHLDGRTARLTRSGIALQPMNGTAYLHMRSLPSDPAAQAAAQHAMAQRTWSIWEGAEPAPTKQKEKHHKNFNSARRKGTHVSGRALSTSTTALAISSPAATTLYSSAAAPPHPLSRLHADGFAVLPAALSRETVQELRRRAVGFALSDSRGVAGLGGKEEQGLSFPDLLAPPHEAALRSMLDVLLGSAVVQAGLRHAFNRSDFAFNGMCDLQFNRSINWHRDLVHPPYMATQRHDVWQPAKRGDSYALYRLVIYLEGHEHDDNALTVIPGSHLERGCRLPCGENRRGYVESPLKWKVGDGAPRLREPVVLRPPLGDAVLFDQRILHRGQLRQDLATGPRITIQVSFGRRDSVFSHEFAEGARLRQREQLNLAPRPPAESVRQACDARGRAIWAPVSGDTSPAPPGRVTPRQPWASMLQPRSAFTCFPSVKSFGTKMYALPARLSASAAAMLAAAKEAEHIAQATAAGSRSGRFATLSLSWPSLVLGSSRPKACAVVGPSGVLLGSGCGRHIDSTPGAVFRTFHEKLPVGGAMAIDVGHRVDIILKTAKTMMRPKGRAGNRVGAMVGASQDGEHSLRPRWQQPGGAGGAKHQGGAGGATPDMALTVSVGELLAGWVREQRLQTNVTALLLDGCQGDVGDEWARVVADAAMAPNLRIVPLRSAYANCVDQYWRRQAAPASPIRWSTGLLLISLALDLCESVDVYGFYPFERYNGTRVPYHYNEAVPTTKDGDRRVVANSHHDWRTEWRLLTSHTPQRLRVHRDSCTA